MKNERRSELFAWKLFAQFKLTREWKYVGRAPLIWVDNNWIELNLVEIYRLFIQCEATLNENDERKWTEIGRIESKIDTRNGFELTGHLLGRRSASADLMSVCRHFRSSYNAEQLLSRFRRHVGSPSTLPGLPYLCIRLFAAIWWPWLRRNKIRYTHFDDIIATHKFVSTNGKRSHSTVARIDRISAGLGAGTCVTFSVSCIKDSSSDLSLHYN